MCTGGSLAHNAANTRTYGRWIVFKTAGGSQALEPSCDLVLPQRPGPIALRLQAEFQYTRIFNESFPPLLWPRSPLSVFLILEAWSFSFPLVFESRTNCPCSMLLLFFFFFFFSFSSSFARFLFPSSLCLLHRHFAVLLFLPFARGFFGVPRYLENSFARPRNRLFIFPRRESAAGLFQAQRRDLSPVKRPWPTATLSPAGAFDVNRHPGDWLPPRKDVSTSHFPTDSTEPRSRGWRVPCTRYHRPLGIMGFLQGSWRWVVSIVDGLKCFRMM